MPKRPWLSVLMPVLNGAQYITEALESVANQHDEGIECLIADGGSTDGTLGLVERFHDRFDIHVSQHGSHLNWVAKTNLALQQARGEFVSILAHDDLWLPGRAARLREIIEAENPDFIIHATQFISDSGRKIGRLTCPLPAFPEPVDRQLLIERLLVQNFIASPSPIIRRQTALDVGGLDEGLWYTADWDFYLKVASVGVTRYLKEPLAAFRVHGKSLTISGSRNPSEFLEQMDIVLERHIDLLPDGRTRAEVYRAAKVSVSVNTALASALHAQKLSLFSAFLEVFRNSPNVWVRYFRDSRIWERMTARMRSGMLKDR